MTEKLYYRRAYCFTDANLDDLEVYNAMGQKVLYMPLSEYEQIKTIDLSHLDNGLYIIKYEKAENIITTAKLILMK